MSKKEEILHYWNEQAIQYKESPLATTPDIIAFEMEINVILKELKDGQTVLNIGCGNGVKDIEYCRHRNIDLKGIDFSQEMIEIAKSQSKITNELKGRLQFEHGDVLKLKEPHTYDVVVTNRCLINLENDEQHIKAISNIYDTLVKNGVFLMLECTQQGLININNVRKEFGLEEIKERWHNKYLDEDKILNYVKTKFTSVKVNNFNSTYFLISRTLNALMAKQSGEINYTSDINQYASKLPPLGEFAPLKLFILQK
ncbi:class I SAM-dependent methyltransferase [Sporomusa malonica]|uniref:Methyltransferase domain-containing protein n=1 Tax=Sporomusa malonica TaxID=112901 RepID=A0A1W1YVZ3_9FIRM|nr:class I SAM-dependent methyltransferase [Sporomusa malonica]SMC40296.1 Methyltransferase domain-containing protein [Sporomusa malonica]